jgi:predicted CopG family antitoxin
MYMTSKTISVSEDAYELLKKMKLKGESFTETIKRLAKRRRLTDCAGLWSDVSEAEMEAIWESIDDLKRSASESLERANVEGR